MTATSLAQKKTTIEKKTCNDKKKAFHSEFITKKPDKFICSKNLTISKFLLKIPKHTLVFI